MQSHDNMQRRHQHLSARHQSNRRPPLTVHQQWRREKGDSELRLNYPLTPDSVVFDLGGYEGEWTRQIFDKYKCFIYVFEPVPALAAKLKSRFASNDKIHVYDFGLSNKDATLQISFCENGSSFHLPGSNLIDAKVKSIVGFIKDNNISSIDLIKLNIEGDEYAVINELLDNDLVDKITNIQVQFHDFVPNAVQMRDDIREKLSLTHTCTYNYVFVWENWARKSPIICTQANEAEMQ